MKSARKQIIDYILSLGLPPKEAEKLFNEILRIMKYTIKIDGYVNLQGFGSFTVKTTKARQIQSKIINGGKPTMTRDRKNVRFKAAKQFKYLLNY
jgi:nucleoid DNA-binding protein